MKLNTPKDKAKLTAEEDKDWEYYLSWYLNNGFTEKQADENAWADLQKKHPRLRRYQGCLP